MEIPSYTRRLSRALALISALGISTILATC